MKAGRRYTISTDGCFVVYARLTPLIVTSNKTMAACLYTTTDNTEVGDEKSDLLLGLSTKTDGGSDEYCCGPIHAETGLYVETYENNTGADTDIAILSVTYINREDNADAYPLFGKWKQEMWSRSIGREGTIYSEQFYPNEINFDEADLSPDGEDDSGAGGTRLESTEKVFITDEMLSVLRTGSKET